MRKIIEECGKNLIIIKKMRKGVSLILMVLNMQIEERKGEKKKRRKEEKKKRRREEKMFRKEFKK